LLASGVLLLPLTVHADPAWPLARFLTAVRDHDPAVAAVRAEGDARRAQSSQQWSALSPHVTASGGFTRSDDPAMLFSQKLWQGRFTPQDFAIDALNQPAPQSALQFAVTVDQPLWNGGREWATPGLVQHRTRAALAMERAGIAARLLGAVTDYVGAVGARERLTAADASLAAATAAHEAALARFRMGQVPELDTLRAAAHHAEARANAIGARGALALATERLERLVDAPVLAADLEAAGQSPAAATGDASTRGEWVAAHEGATVAATESRLAAGRLLPTLNSRFAVTQYRPFTGGAYERRWMVALAADLPLFDGGQRIQEWRAAKATAAQAAAQARTAERDLAWGLEAARLEFDVARERRDAAASGRAAADEALRLATLRYRAGLLPFTEFLATDAQTNASRAAAIEAETNVTLAAYRLLYAQGALR
jgi:outer membrane protein TolC